MTTAVLSLPKSRTRGFVPRSFSWTCGLFHDLCDTGLMEGRNVILVSGEIVEMPPPNPPLNTGLTLTNEALRTIFPRGYVIRNQMALDLDLHTDPVPDLAVVVGEPRDFTTRQATTAELVVEISDSTLDYDTTTKAELYAAGRIAEYWIVDVANRKLHVYRKPVAKPAGRGGNAYRTRQTFGPNDTVSPLAMPTAIVKVADLLP